MVVFFSKGVLGCCSADHRVVEAGVAVVEVETVLAVELFRTVFVGLHAHETRAHQPTVRIIVVYLLQRAVFINHRTDVALVVGDVVMERAVCPISVGVVHSLKPPVAVHVTGAVLQRHLRYRLFHTRTRW